MTSRTLAWLAAVLLAASSVAAQVPSTSPKTVDVHVLAINDFHGALEPPVGATGRIGNANAGGVEFLATELATLKAQHPQSVIVSAGDNIGGSPLLSSLSHDEASVEAMNSLGLQLSAVGNHELDKGWWELDRIQRGGCHPVDGCQGGTQFAGASFQYLAANIVLDPRRADPKVVAREHVAGTQPRLLVPPSRVVTIGGVRIGFIGAILQAAPSMISPPSTQGLIFTPEAEAVNAEASRLRQQGVHAIVVLAHDGGIPDSEDINGCGLSREFLDVIDHMSADIDVVASGHTHRAYNCTIGGKLVTSASSNGRVITDIDLQIGVADDRIVSKTARNIPVTRDLPRDRAETALIEHYRPIAERIGHRVVGHVTATLPARENESGESLLGDVIADAMLEGARRTPHGEGSVVAFMNDGGIRADVVASGRSTPVTFSQLFDVTPFANVVTVKSVTGDAILRVLEQQRVQVSRGFTFTYDPRRPSGQRLDRASVRLNGEPIVPAKIYRVVSIDFVFNTVPAFASATDPVTVGVDVDVLADYFSRHSPVTPPELGRIRR